MWYLANAVVSRIGLQETAMLIVTMLLSGVYLLSWVWMKGPVGRLGLGVWIPILMALNAVRGGWLGTRELYSYLQQTGAINEAQRELMFDRAIHGGIRTFVLGTVCSAILWQLVRRNQNACAKYADAEIERQLG